MCKIFEQWANEIFFPYVIEKRKRLHYNGNALIILDGLGAHDSVGFKEGCTHTQCVLHIIRLRLIIFHTPKNFHGDFSL